MGRNVQAFEALFELQDDEASHRVRGDGSRRRSGSRGGRGSELVRGFRLREDSEPSAADHSLASDDRTQLLELFGASLPADLITDVYLSCGSNIVAATEALLSMSSGDVGDGAQQAAVDEEDTMEQQQQQMPRGSTGDSSAAARDPCWWDELPHECRELVFEHLTLREMAVAARTCQEWAAYARTQRSGLSAVRVPRDVTLTTLRGLVAAFGAAEEVDLRCAML